MKGRQVKYSIWIICLVFQSCSIQKRHYLKGFYVENPYSKLNTQRAITGCSFQQKLRPVFIRNTTEHFIRFSEENNTTIFADASSKHILINERNYFHSVFPKWEHIKHDSLKHKIPDPGLNRVAKAGFRMSMYSLVILSGALYLFFALDTLFYILLGAFIIAFIFALVSLLTSVAAGNDRVATNRTGLRFSRFGIIMSLLIFAAIASFFIFAPLIF